MQRTLSMLWWTLLPLTQYSHGATLSIEVTGVADRTGPIEILVWPGSRAKGFPMDTSKAVCHETISASTTPATAVCDLEAGIYAVLALYDANANGQLDHAWYGAPLEPIGFSGGCRPRFGPPPFRRCRFKLEDSGTAIEVEVR